MSLDGAEKLKIALANDPLIALKPRPGESKEEFRKRQKQEDELDLQKLGIYEQTEPLSKRTILEGIMVPRMKEMFSLILAELQKNHLVAGVPAGLVLSGGGAETVGIVEVAKRTLNLPARVGKPTELRGLVDDIQKPSYATSIGLLIYAAKRSAARPVVASTPLSDYFKKIRFQDLGGQVVKLVKSFLP